MQITTEYLSIKKAIAEDWSVVDDCDMNYTPALATKDYASSRPEAVGRDRQEAAKSGH